MFEFEESDNSVSELGLYIFCLSGHVNLWYQSNSLDRWLSQNTSAKAYKFDSKLLSRICLEVGAEIETTKTKSLHN